MAAGFFGRKLSQNDRKNYGSEEDRMKNIKKFRISFFHAALLVVNALAVFTIAFSASYFALTSGVGENAVHRMTGLSTTNIDENIAIIKEVLPKPYIVQSGSMEPAIMTASLIFSASSETYSAGDVITFHAGNRTVSHRITSVIQSNGAEASYITKGDANKDPDIGAVAHNQVVGKVIFTVPYLGYVADFAKTPHGFILLVIVPATIIIYEELKFISTQILHSIRKITNGQGRTLTVVRKLFRKKSDEDGDSGENGGKMWTKFSVTIPIVGAFLVMVGLAAAYFSDTEMSVGNIFRASDDFGNNIAKTLVINEVLPSTGCKVGNTEAQWIELYNGFDFPVNPKNYEISDSTSTISLVNAGNLTIQPGELLLLAHNAAIWGTTPNTCWDNKGAQTGNLGGQLDINSSKLQLIDPDGIVIDTVEINDTHYPTLITDRSIERDPMGFDTKLGEFFEPTDFKVQDEPTPGTGLE